MPPLSRPQLLDALDKLLPAQFETLLFNFNMPNAWIRRNATQTEQAIDLIRYAESQGRLVELEKQVQSPASPDTGNTAFNQTGQHVGQQINVAGSMHIHGDVVAGNKIVQTVTGNENIFSGTGNIRVEKKMSRQ
jgi:hypothetical protein